MPSVVVGCGGVAPPTQCVRRVRGGRRARPGRSVQVDESACIKFKEEAIVGIGNINFENLMRRQDEGPYKGPAAIIGQDLLMQKRCRARCGPPSALCRPVPFGPHRSCVTVHKQADMPLASARETGSQ